MGDKELDEYWRSDSGQTAYRQMLDAHFERLRRESDGVELLKTVGEIEVFALHGVPEHGAKMLVTKGVSRFILDTGIRVEFAISLKEEYSSEAAAQILLDLATSVLKRRTPWEEYTVISDVDFSNIGRPVNVRHLVLILGHWLSETEHFIGGHYPTFIVELVPLVHSEAELLRKDRARFLEAGRNGLIDPLDLRRAELPSTFH